jgi:hypothetical protein
MECKSLQKLTLPRILFGSERQVQKAWRTVVKRAWKLREWSSVVDDLEMVSATDVDALIVSSSPLLRSTNPDCWRMYAVGEGFKKVAMDAMAPGPEGLDEFDSLLLDGMKWLWFTIGLLESGGGRFNLTNFPRTRPIIEVLYDYIDRFAYWLPDLVDCEAVLQDDFWFADSQYGYRCPWAFSIVALAADCGVELPFEASESGEVLLESLLRTGLIETFEGRYRARRSKSKPVE